MIGGALLTLLLVFLNGFFVAAEFAIVKVRASQIEIKAKSGGRVANMAKHIMANLDRYIAATQLGVTLSSLGLGWVGEQVFKNIVTEFFWFINVPISDVVAHNLSFAVAFLIITMLHIIFGELAPKSYALQRPVATTMATALPLHVFYLVFKPLIWFLNGVANVILRSLGIRVVDGHEAYHSTEELQYLLEQGKQSGAIDSSEHELIKNVFDFNDRLVKSIMVPRTKIAAVEIGSSHEVVLEKLIKEAYSRIPIYEGSIDKIVGIVHAKDILPLLVSKQELVIKEIIRTPLFVPETKKINDLLSELQAKRIQMAIVLDEFGGTAGIVTLEDIVEELVGEIQDEHDEEKPIVERLTDTEFVVNAAATIHDVNEYLPHDLPENQDYDTISGMASAVFEKIPEVGEQIHYHGYLLTVLKKSNQNIESVKFELTLLPEDQKDTR